MISDLLDEIQQRETEELRDIKDQNCYAAGYAAGALAAVKEIRDLFVVAVPAGCPCDFRYKLAPIVEACRACGREIGSWLACPRAPEHQ